MTTFRVVTQAGRSGVPDWMRERPGWRSHAGAWEPEEIARPYLSFPQDIKIALFGGHIQAAFSERAAIDG